MSLYHPMTDRHPRLLAVFAHPDDEVFCAGGMLAQWAAAGNETMVLSATRGEAGQIQDAQAATRLTLGAVRERELRLACQYLGVRQVECLDHRDGALREVDEATLASEVADRIRSFAPDIVVTFGPDGGYGHPDHCAISAATTRACQQIARAGGHTPHLYYSAFPRQHRLLSRSVARWLAQRDSPFQGSKEFVRALALLAEEATLLGYADDTVQTQWFPAGFSIVEQGEVGSCLYLIISGHAEIIQEDASGRRVCRQVGPGQFFGEEALARNQEQRASVVARDTVTCLSLSPRAPTSFDARGADAQRDDVLASLVGLTESVTDGLTHVDVSSWLDCKIAALSAHRSQFAMEPEFLLYELLGELLGCEYFTRVAFSAAPVTLHAIATDEALDLDAMQVVTVSA